MDGMAEALGSPDAQRELAQLMDGLDQLSGHDVVHTSICFHPDGPGGVTTALFSLTTQRLEQPNPRLSVARTALSIARATLWRSSHRRFIELPSALPCYLISGVISVPGLERELFQARVATAHADGIHLLVLDLTSASTQHADAYTDILEAIVHTMSFADPAPSKPTTAGTSRIQELLR
ncbi:hypothetical protein [Streptomyces xanthophaeus]